MENLNIFGSSKLKLLVVALALQCIASCSQESVPGTFQLLPKEEGLEVGFEVGEEVISNSKAPVDILWVIDNSASMRPSQEKLKKGLSSFAKNYLHSDYDIQMAVITTDVFVANSQFQDYLNTKTRIDNKTPRDFLPAFGPEYALLTPGKKHTSGRPLVSTLANPAQENSSRIDYSSSALLRDFIKNISVGTDGLYEERAFDSVLQFLSDNESDLSKSPLKLFRNNSTRIIVFLGDEDDQSLVTSYIPPEPKKLLYRGSYYVGKDDVQADSILPAHFTIHCPASTVEGVELAPMSICVRPGLLLPVSSFKNQLDSFFEKLEGKKSANPYLVVSIVPKDLKTIESLRGEVQKEITHERGSRFLELVDLVGNGSFSMDIGVDDYSPILDRIGLEIESRTVLKTFEQFTEFKLTRKPTSKEDLKVWIKKENGTQLDVKPEQFEINNTSLIITDKNLIATLTPRDRLHVWYVPQTVLSEEDRVR